MTNEQSPAGSIVLTASMILARLLTVDGAGSGLDADLLDGQSGAYYAPVTLTAIGATPNANGASLSGQALTLQPADATYGGVLTATTQSILGLKTLLTGLIVGTDPGGSELLRVGGAFRASGTNYIGSGLATQYLVVDGGNSGSIDGAAILLRNAGVGVIGFGNYSAIYGGAYNAQPNIFAASTVFCNQGLVLGTDPGGSELLRVGGVNGISTGGDAKLVIYHDTNSAFISSTYTTGAGYKPLTFRTSDTNRLTLNADGTLVLGTDPGGSELLRVGGNVTVNGDVRVASGGYFYNSSGDLNVRGGAELRLGSNSIDNRVRLLSDGSFVLGTDPGGSDLLRLGGSQVLVTGGNLRLGTAAVATTATAGFLYLSSCAGTPTGVPTTLTGTAPAVIDTTNNILYFYSTGAWRSTASASLLPLTNTWTAANTIAPSSAVVPLTITQGTITTNLNALSLTSTWNAGGVTFTGIKLNVTNTASATASKLFDLQTGGTSRFSVDVYGNATIAPLANGTASGLTISQGAITTAATGLALTSTWNQGATNFTGLSVTVTDTASSASSYPLIVNVTGIGAIFYVDKNGLHGGSYKTTVTNTTDVLSLRIVSTTGTAADGFGCTQNLYLQASDGNSYQAGKVATTWATAAFATRKSRVAHFAEDASNPRECLRMEASGSAAMIGFLGASAVVRPSMAAATGTATRTTFDTATVTLPQLAERFKAIIDDLRGFGLEG